MRSRGPVRGRHARGAPVWFAAFTLVSLVMLLLSSTEPARTVQRAAGAVLEPARGAFGAVAETVADAFGAIGEIGSLRDENEALRTRLAAADQRVAELTDAAAENAELRGLLGLTRTLEMELLAVRVTAREPGNFLAECVVDAGSEEGVAAGMAVLADAGGAGALVGTVIEVTDRTARVRFVVDTRSVVIAVDQETRALGEVRGRAGGQLVFTNVPVTERIGPDDSVVSAGITVGDDSSLYPPGLLLGRVQAVEPDPNALTQTAYLVPAVDPADLERLLIVLDSEGG